VLVVEGLEFGLLEANPGIRDAVILAIKDNVLKAISQPEWSRDVVGVRLRPGSVVAEVVILAVPQASVGASDYEATLAAVYNDVDFSDGLAIGVSREIASIEGIESLATGPISVGLGPMSWSTTYTTTAPVPKYVACPLDEETMPCAVQDALLLLAVAVQGPLAFGCFCWVAVYVSLCCVRKCRRVEGGTAMVKDLDDRPFQAAFRIVRAGSHEDRD